MAHSNSRYTISPKKEMKILADYAELQSCKKVALLNGVCATTVRNIVHRNPEAEKILYAKRAELNESVLAYMDSKKDKVCKFLDQALDEIQKDEKFAKASMVQIATSMGILIDKWTNAAGASTGVSVSISGGEEAGD